MNAHYAVEWMGFNAAEVEIVEGNPLWILKVPENTSAVMPSGVGNDFKTEITLDTDTRYRCIAVHDGVYEFEGPDGMVVSADGIYEIEVLPDE